MNNIGIKNLREQNFRIKLQKSERFTILYLTLFEIIQNKNNSPLSF